MFYLKIFILLSVFLLSGHSFSQDQNSYNQLFDNIMKKINGGSARDHSQNQKQREEEDLSKYFNDKMLLRMDKMMKDMNDSFNQAFDSKISAGFFSSNSLKHKWEDREKTKVLILDVESTQTNPVKVNIKDNVIQVSGKVEQVTENKTSFGSSRSVRVYQFDEAIPLPKGVSIFGMKVESHKGKTHIIFKKNS